MKIRDRVLPLLVLAITGYGSWVYSSAVWHHAARRTAIGLIIGNILFLLLIFSIWLQILILGPGIQPALPKYRLIPDGEPGIEPPSVFSCDERGFPKWCSHCQSIKAERAHHSARTGRCVPRFDHYCVLLGAVVGKRNHRLFIQLCILFWLYFIYAATSLGVYTSGTDGNVIAVFVLLGFWFVMLTAMTGEHLVYIYINKCTVDTFEARRLRQEGKQGVRYHSVWTKDGRRVVSVPSTDYRVWNRGIRLNWVDVMGSGWRWGLPWGSPVVDLGDPKGTTCAEILGDYNEVLNEAFIKKLAEVEV